MKTLTRAEEDIMLVLWKLKKAFVKEIVARMKAPKPHYNTVSTIISILVEKGFVSYESYGKSYQYYPVVSKEDYSKKLVKQIVKRYYGNSFTNLVEQFAEERSFKADEIRKVLKESARKSKIRK